MPLRPTPPSPRLVRAQIDSAKTLLDSNVSTAAQKVKDSETELDQQVQLLKGQKQSQAYIQADVKVLQIQAELQAKRDELETATQKLKAFQAPFDRAVADLARVDQLDPPD